MADVLAPREAERAADVELVARHDAEVLHLQNDGVVGLDPHVGALAGSGAARGAAGSVAAGPVVRRDLLAVLLPVPVELRLEDGERLVGVAGAHLAQRFERARAVLVVVDRHVAAVGDAQQKVRDVGAAPPIAVVPTKNDEVEVVARGVDVVRLELGPCLAAAPVLAAGVNAVQRFQQDPFALAVERLDQSRRHIGSQLLLRVSARVPESELETACCCTKGGALVRTLETLMR